MRFLLPTNPAASAGPTLRDIHLPPTPPWWPPAPGWWLVFGLLCGLLLLGIWQWRRWLNRRRQRQQLLTELKQFAQAHRLDGDDAVLATRLHQLLRRVARRHVPQATQQRGAAWRQTLSTVTPDSATLESLLVLEQTMYRKDTRFEADTAITATRRWLLLAQKPAHWKRAARAQADV